MGQPADFNVSDALETLVNQFADRLSFLRELIQNAIDAGSPEIDVRIEYDADKGMIVIEVDDFGEGMDAAIIDTRLTRLFSSSKDDDFTKIGRFGIGFVSVFAIEPDAVCVDTSRGGETWRVLFKSDRSFVRIALDQPVEGTVVRIFKRATPAEVDEMTDKARAVITYWCKHATSQIRFQGEVINRPLDIDSPCRVRYEEEGTEVVVGLTMDEEPLQGFYNRGLTLLETREAIFPHVELKVSSRYLEHTLTRDNVLRDANYEKAISIVERLVRGPLPARLFELLEADVKARQHDETTDRLYELAATWLVTYARSGLRLAAWTHRDRVVLRSASDEEVTLGDCEKAKLDGSIFCARIRSLLTDELERDGKLIALCPPRSMPERMLRALLDAEPVQVNRAFCTAPIPRQDPDPAREALRRALSRLLDAHGARVKGVAIAGLAYPDSAVAQRVAITQREIGEVTPLDEVGDLPSSFFSGRRFVVLNADHPTVKRLVALAEHEPELAAYVAAKLFHLRSELRAEVDGELAAIAWKQRCKRTAA
jgi:hypothetical protein